MHEKIPDPRKHPALDEESGLYAVGLPMTIENLTEGYRLGLFPWPMSGILLPWFSPPERGVLFLKDLVIPRSLKKAQKKAEKEAEFHFTENQDFLSVIEGCAKTPRPGQRGTWITAPIKRAYFDLFKHEKAWCIEVWDREKNLVGGVYGVKFGKFFSAESMFYLRPNASKLALLTLFNKLKERQIAWLDIQVLTPHMEKFGAKSIPRSQFLNLLDQSFREE